MGRLKKKGSIGQISGAVGDVVISDWNNIPVVRSRSTKRSKPASQGMLDQQAKMKAAGRFTKTIKAVVSVGFQEYAVQMSGYNAAIKDLLKYGITGQYPDYAINFSKVLVSRGRLLNEANSAAKAESGMVVFTWTHENSDQVAGDDKAILVVYAEALNKSLFTLKGADRSSGTASIAAARFKGYEVHTWLAFVSADGTAVSDSVYTGKVTIT